MGANPPPISANAFALEILKMWKLWTIYYDSKIIKKTDFSGRVVYGWYTYIWSNNIAGDTYIINRTM